MADIGVNTVMNFMDRLIKRAKQEKISDPEILKELIVSALQNGPLKKAEIYEAMKHAFPDVLTEEKQYKKLSNLLQQMKKEGIVGVRGYAVHAEWFLVETA